MCTFKSSKTSVSRGTAVRLSGVVPTEGHWGSTAGKRKYVTIYTAKYGKAVPTWWNPVGHGWYKLITVRTDGYGRFHTPLMKPYGSNTVIARYNGDNLVLGRLHLHGQDQRALARRSRLAERAQAKPPPGLRALKLLA